VRHHPRQMEMPPPYQSWHPALLEEMMTLQAMVMSMYPKHAMWPIPQRVSYGTKRPPYTFGVALP
jgi:hypothetical protein